MVEAGPVIQMKKADRLDRSTVLSHYPFEWDEPALHPGLPARLGRPAQPLRHTQLQDRSPTSRATCSASTTLRGIKAGEELTWNYGIDPWFKVAN